MVRVGLSLLLIAALGVSSVAHGFSLTDAQGKVHRLEDYRGRWVLVNFWATWCPPCLEEIPDLVALYEGRRKVMVLGIAMDYRDRETVLKFADQMFMSYPVVFGDQAVSAQFGKLKGLPTTYLYGPDGRLAATRVGPVTQESIERFIDEHSPKNRGAQSPVIPVASAKGQAVRPE
ncbi:MAG TPA: TlpA disulfide reductase family protein [Burkholderiales bacterium]|nr:TlpA disulfide reductase family protein [Burkholderiales bacterium]